jgi:hypothetical protein
MKRIRSPKKTRRRDWFGSRFLQGRVSQNHRWKKQTDSTSETDQQSDPIYKTKIWLVCIEKISYYMPKRIRADSGSIQQSRLEHHKKKRGSSQSKYTTAASRDEEFKSET